ncbi:hypothetical protein ACC764_38475, partial [Rhizobium ruizarguesonis]
RVGGEVMQLAGEQAAFRVLAAEIDHVDPFGLDAAGGTIFTNASDATKSTDSKAAADALAAKNIPAEAFKLNAYAAVEVLKAGIEKAG